VFGDGANISVKAFGSDPGRLSIDHGLPARGTLFRVECVQELVEQD